MLDTSCAQLSQICLCRGKGAGLKEEEGKECQCRVRKHLMTEEYLNHYLII